MDVCLYYVCNFQPELRQLAHCACEILIINDNACKPLEMDAPYKFPHLRDVSTDKSVAFIVQSPVIRNVINANPILVDLGAASRVEGIFVCESLLQEGSCTFPHENPFHPTSCPWVSEDALTHD